MSSYNLPSVRLNTYKDKDIIDDLKKQPQNRKSERIREMYRKGLQMEKLTEQGLTIVPIHHLQYLEQMIRGGSLPINQQGQAFVPVQPIQQSNLSQQPPMYQQQNPPMYQYPNLSQQQRQPLYHQVTPVPQPQREHQQEAQVQQIEQETIVEPQNEAVTKQPSKVEDTKLEESFNDHVVVEEKKPDPPKIQEESAKHQIPPNAIIDDEDEDDDDDDFMNNLGSNFNF